MDRVDQRRATLLGVELGDAVGAPVGAAEIGAIVASRWPLA